jgi:glyoxylase-like metal-dependent hydrolase (beta-lactamase superfamily II)
MEPDFIAVIEPPANEARSNAVIAEVKKTIPNKPIRYIVATHHHFDHLGGLRTYVAEGAIVVTDERNKDYFQKVVMRHARKDGRSLLASERSASHCIT